jgi:hypothetical protein
MAWIPSQTNINNPDDLQVLQNFSYTIQYIDSQYGTPQPVTLTAITQSYPTVILTNGSTASIGGYYQYVFEGSVIKYKEKANDNTSFKTITQPQYGTTIWDDFAEADVYAMTSFKADRTLYHYYNYLATAVDSQQGKVTQTYIVTLTNFWDAGQRALKQAVQNQKEGK